jgi:predicted dehydrogenase
VYRASRAAWEEIPPPANFDRNDMFLDEMRHFRAVARAVEEPVCSLEDGERVLQIALAARQSSQTGQSVEI